MGPWGQAAPGPAVAGPRATGTARSDPRPHREPGRFGNRWPPPLCTSSCFNQVFFFFFFPLHRKAAGGNLSVLLFLFFKPSTVRHSSSHRPAQSRSPPLCRRCLVSARAGERRPAEGPFARKLLRELPSVGFTSTSLSWEKPWTRRHAGKDSAPCRCWEPREGLRACRDGAGALCSR